MDSAVPMLLFLGFLFAAVLLILVLGYRSIEAERNQKAAEDSGGLDLSALSRSSRFFALAGEKPAADRPAAIEAVTDYLRLEWRYASEFGLQPSIERLYRGTRPDVEPLVEEVERYLAGERLCEAAVAGDSALLHARRETVATVAGRTSRAAPPV